MNRWLIFILSICAFVLTSCGGSGDKDVISSEAIYFDYTITAQEENDNLTIFLQYRHEDEEGDAINPGKVALDGEQLKGDSSKMTGFYFEVQKPIVGFEGTHRIRFTGNDQKQYIEEFIFRPLQILNQIPPYITREDLLLELKGLEPGEQVRVVMTDTAFANDGINRLDSAIGGRLVISASELAGLSNGPVHLELIKESDRPVRNGTAMGGKLSVSYSIRRELVLLDSLVFKPLE